MAPSTADSDELRPIRKLLRRTARALRWSRAAGGLALALGAAAWLLLGLAVADLVSPFATWGRVAAVGVLAAAAIGGIVWGAIRPLVRRIDPASIARRIESQRPELKERLVCCVDLLEVHGATGVAHPFQKRLVKEARERIAGFRPSQAIDANRLQRAISFGGAAVLAFGLCWLATPQRLPTALARILTPLADLPPASGATLFVIDADRKILRGSDATFVVRTSSPDVGPLTLQLTNLDDGRRLAYPLRPESSSAGEWRLTLNAYEHSFRYRVYGAGTWTREHRVEVIDRPRIVAWTAAVRPPAYLGPAESDSASAAEADSPHVVAVAGSTVDVSVEVSGDAASGVIQLLAPQTRKSVVEQRPERAWMTDSLPAGATAQGVWKWEIPEHLGRPAHTEPPAEGTHVHSFLNAATGFVVRPGENLFAWVWLSPERPPRSVMVQWHDGQSWEHRAFWGDDLVEWGRPGTASRRYMGPLPTLGRWVRLEVPAALVGLEGRQLRGLSFTLHDGAAWWHRAGAVPPAEIESHELRPARSFPLTRTSAGRWRGSFPLEDDGHYRPELFNELGHANPPAPPARLTALDDRQPEVVIESPAEETVLAEPRPLSIVVAARDDFGLAELTLRVRRESWPSADGTTAPGESSATPTADDDASRSRTAFDAETKKYPAAVKSDRATLTLDAAALDLAPGERLVWSVVARDRKGTQTASPEFALRIEAPAPTPLDRELARLLDFARRWTGLNLGDPRRVQNVTARLRAWLERLARGARPHDEPTGDPASGGATNSIAGTTSKEPGDAAAPGGANAETPAGSAALRLPPEVREALLKAGRSGGPPGYEGFVRDYFERLTRAASEP